MKCCKYLATCVLRLKGHLTRKLGSVKIEFLIGWQEIPNRMARSIQ